MSKQITHNMTVVAKEVEISSNFESKYSKTAKKFYVLW